MKWVAKEWGVEIWLVNTEKYCAKQLHLAPLSQCSLHRHLVKDETFVVVSGYPELEIGDARFEARPGESFRVEPGVWHRFTNRFAHVFVQMLEVSTHHDDNDVERREPSRRLIDETEPPHRTDHRAGDSVCGPAEGVQRAGSELECLGEGDGV